MIDELDDLDMADEHREVIGDRRSTKSSVRTILEGGILLGIGWIISSNVQQGKDVSSIKTTLEFAIKNTDKIPEMDMRIRNLEKTGEKVETRISNLETLERAK